MQTQLLRALVNGLFALGGACATQPALKIQAVDCTAVRFPIQLSMAGALQGFAGQYSDGVHSVTLRQEGYEVLLGIAGTAERELRQTAEWRFEDGCGTAYQLSLPLNGVGASLDVISRGGQLIRLQHVRRDLG
jgi:hypothetical protein